MKTLTLLRTRKPDEPLSPGQVEAIKSFVAHEGIKGICLFYRLHLRTVAKLTKLQRENQQLKARLSRYENRKENRNDLLPDHPPQQNPDSR